jgi:hypothetical protein
MSVISGPILISSASAASAASAPVERIDAVLARLEAPPPQRSASPVLSSLAGVVSFGLLPLLIWPQRWEAAVETDRRDLGALAAWWQRAAGPAQAQQLGAAANSLGGAAGVSSFLLTAVAVSGSLLLTWLLWHGVTVEHLLAIAYRPHPLFRLIHDRPRELRLSQLWMAMLVVAYGLHYLTIRSHVSAIKRYVAAADAAASSVGLQWRSHRYVFRGLGPMWIVCGVAMCGAGLWWGAPLVMAGARQRQYLRQVRPRLRGDMAAMARAAMGPPPARFARCATAGCKAPLPMSARFCPRCGAAA